MSASVHAGIPEPPRDQAEPPRTRQTPSQTRQTPLGPGRHPPDQADPPRPGRYPLDQADPSQTRQTAPGTSRQTPPNQADPPDQVDTPLDQEDPPGTRQTPPRPGSSPPPREADCSIRSTSGRYTCYWNAFLYNTNVLSEHLSYIQSKTKLVTDHWPVCSSL